MERVPHLPRVLFLGMQGSFSFPSLRALLESGVEVCAVVLPASAAEDKPALYARVQQHPTRSLLPLLNSTLSRNIVQLAWAHALPLWEVTQLADSLTVTTLAAYQPDIICVSCFSQRLPRAILAIARLGCLNAHPSLLPANRGPVPLFWTFRSGDEQTGVSIHLMGEGMDSGAVLAQQALPVPAGIDYATLEAHCAELGGELLVRTVWELYNGRAVKVPQDESSSSYHSFPVVEDYHVLVAQWHAVHVYNFICGVGTWGEPVKLFVEGEVFQTRHAIAYSLNDREDQRGKAYFWQDALLWVRCQLGWVGVTALGP